MQNINRHNIFKIFRNVASSLLTKLIVTLATAMLISVCVLVRKLITQRSSKKEETKTKTQKEREIGLPQKKEDCTQGPTVSVQPSSVEFKIEPSQKRLENFMVLLLGIAPEELRSLPLYKLEQKFEEKYPKLYKDLKDIISSRNVIELFDEQFPQVDRTNINHEEELIAAMLTLQFEKHNPGQENPFNNVDEIRADLNAFLKEPHKIGQPFKLWRASSESEQEVRIRVYAFITPEQQNDISFNRYGYTIENEPYLKLLEKYDSVAKEEIAKELDKDKKRLKINTSTVYKGVRESFLGVPIPLMWMSSYYDIEKQ